MNKIKIVGLSLLLVFMFSTSCFAKTEIQQLGVYEEDETVSIESKEEYENNLENEITVNDIKYRLKDVQEQKNEITLIKEKEEQEQKIVETDDKYSVLNLFDKEKQIKENGYIGILELQNDSLDLQTNDSYTEQYKVTLTKRYDNVPQNELNDIPKTIIENGTTYYLTDPIWNVAQTQKIDGQDIPTTYNGIMNYEGIKERVIIKNYIATVNYKGTLQKEEIDSITYHLIYEEVPIEEKMDYTPIIATTTGLVIFSGIIVIKRKNILIYNYKNGAWKLVKKLHIAKNEKVINITPTTPTIYSKYKIVLNNRLYHDLLHQNVTIKYFDKEYIYEIKQKEFEICV